MEGRDVSGPLPYGGNAEFRAFATLLLPGGGYLGLNLWRRLHPPRHDAEGTAHGVYHSHGRETRMLTVPLWGMAIDHRLQGPVPAAGQGQRVRSGMDLMVAGARWRLPRYRWPLRCALYRGRDWHLFELATKRYLSLVIVWNGEEEAR